MLGTMRIQSFIKFLNCLLFNEKTGLKTSRKQQLIRAVKKKKKDNALRDHRKKMT